MDAHSTRRRLDRYPQPANHPGACDQLAQCTTTGSVSSGPYASSQDHSARAGMRCVPAGSFGRAAARAGYVQSSPFASHS